MTDRELTRMAYLCAAKLSANDVVQDTAKHLLHELAQRIWELNGSDVRDHPTSLRSALIRVDDE